MRAILLALLLTVSLFAGCADPEEKDDAEPSGSGSSSASRSGSASRTGSGSATATSTAAPAARNATLSADVVDGTAPLSVNFTINATGGPASWRLSFGDGASANGTAVPALVNHTYAVGGNFSANLTVVYAVGANASASVSITVAVPAGGGAPDVTHFEFGESLGCAADANAANPAVPPNCVSFQAGPDSPSVDGHWFAVDERYWGMTMTTTMDEPTGANADSDCFFVAEDGHTLLGNGHNGGSLCMGVVPDGTMWIFLYPWGLPATGMTADFATA